MRLRTLASTCVLACAIAGAAAAQPLDTNKPAQGPGTALASASSEISVSGKVVSSSSTELVIDSDAGQRMTFALDPDTTTPTTFTAGERVAVRYHSSSGGTVHQAASIAVEPPTEVRSRPNELRTSSTSPRLPDTASGLPLIGLLGLLAVSGAVAVRVVRS